MDKEKLLVKKNELFTLTSGNIYDGLSFHGALIALEDLNLNILMEKYYNQLNKIDPKEAEIVQVKDFVKWLIKNKLAIKPKYKDLYIDETNIKDNFEEGC